MSSSRPAAPSSEELVLHVTLFILSAVGLFVLLRLPRALARFWCPSEWLRGHVFWHTPYRHTRARRVYASASDTSSKETASDDSHTLYVHNSNNKSQAQVQTTFDLPPHVAACPAFLQRLVMLLRVRLSPGFSVAQAAIMASYFAALLYAGLYKSSPFSDPVRTGWVAVSQLPIAIALATKNNILGSLMGFAYEKVRTLPSFRGVCNLSFPTSSTTSTVFSVSSSSSPSTSTAWATVSVCHTYSLRTLTLPVYKWSIAGTFQASIQRPSVIWGLVGLVAFDCIFFFSLSFWRHRFHNIMLPVHVASLAVALPAIWKHKPSTMRWICACIGIYALDRLCRVLKTRLSTATLRALPALGCTRVEVPHINGGWRAGQHVRLRVLSSAMGRLAWAEAHPFTIASVADGEEGIVLLVKKSGRWTQRLYDLAQSSGATEAGRERRVSVLVEGPYGGPCHAIFASYSAAVFIVGGSGITFALAAIDALIRADLAGRSRVKSITLIWSVQDPAALRPLLPRLAALVDGSAYTPVHVAVHYTRAFAFPGGAGGGAGGGGAGGAGKKPLMASALAAAHPRIALSAGRPQILRSLEAALARAVGLVQDPRDERRVSGMLVGVCGPVGLGDDVARAVAGVDPARREQVGGIEMHEE
ncbi:hypothetical protein C0993_004095 [Termitomyces sp. T159_Od127]|nr:hypothetical protein C0993_004095 [Termitomyces sp. T159_Od127]